VVSKVDAVPARVLREKPEHLPRFTAALLAASRYFAENKQPWIEAMQRRRPDVEGEDLAALWDQFQSSWAVNGALNLGDYRETTEFVYQSESFKDVPRIQVEDWVDTQVLDSVLRTIGVYEKFDEPGRRN